MTSGTGREPDDEVAKDACAAEERSRLDEERDAHPRRPTRSRTGTEREKLFGRIARLVGRGIDRTTNEETVVAAASGPDPDPWTVDLREMLRDLEARMPLVQDYGARVRERLSVVVDRPGRRAWIDVDNVVGEMERTTTFELRVSSARVFEAWCTAREESMDLGTAWDVARRTRRVVEHEGRPWVVDPGVNAIADALAPFGCRLSSSCEGHPHGAYLVIPDAPSFQSIPIAVLRACGWSVVASDQGIVARMPIPNSVAERDANWRRLHEGLVGASFIQSDADENERHRRRIAASRLVRLDRTRVDPTCS